MISQLFMSPLGRLDDSANMYGEVFVNGAKASLHYGTYVSKVFVYVKRIQDFLTQKAQNSEKLLSFLISKPFAINRDLSKGKTR